MTSAERLVAPAPHRISVLPDDSTVLCEPFPAPAPDRCHELPEQTGHLAVETGQPAVPLIRLGFGEVKPSKVTKPLAGHFEKAGVTPRRHLVEIRTADAENYALGQEIGVDVFTSGEKIDVTGTSKGKGFAGVMKRHGFSGVSASHGSHRNHRKPGSIGGCATPGRVFKGMRMAGRMGVETITTQNLPVHSVDSEKGLVLVKGAIPGARGTVVLLRSAAKAKGADK